MMLIAWQWVLRNRGLVGLILVALAAAGLWFYIKALQEDRDTYKAERDAAQASLSQCVENQKISYEVSNEYQKALTSLNDKLAALKRVRGARCVVPSNPSSRSNAGAKQGLHAGEDGLSTDWLYDFSAECERYRLQVIGLQSYVRRTSEK